MPQELEKLLGQVPIPVGEVYLSQDPPRMFKAIRQTRRPCLAFKILAAGRLSERKPWVEQAFRQTFESIKPSDAVIVGIYDRYSDQPAENAAVRPPIQPPQPPGLSPKTRRFGASAFRRIGDSSGVVGYHISYAGTSSAIRTVNRLEAESYTRPAPCPNAAEAIKAILKA